jgi:predicted porin
MKKTLIALATLAATGAVMAQSSVTVYGVIDQAFPRTSNSNGGGSNTGLTSSANVTNRLGFRGTEDLGGGLSAKFQIETNLSADAPTATTLGDRGAWVSLASATMGEVRLGRDYNNAFWNPILFTAWGTNGVGATVFHASRAAYFGAGTGLGTGAGFVGTTHASDPYIWNNNSISYILPGNLGGVYGNIQHAFDEAAAPSSLGQSTNMRLGYKAGALDVAFGTVRSMA